MSWKSVLPVAPGVLLFLWAHPVPAEDILAVDNHFAEVAGWDVGYDKSRDLCIATTEYENNTTLSVGIQTSSGSGFLGFSNSNWGGLEPTKSYRIKLVFTPGKVITGDFVGAQHGDNKALYADDVPQAVLQQFAQAVTLELFYNQITLGRYSLKASSKAISTILGCTKAYHTGDPFRATDQSMPPRPLQTLPEISAQKSATLKSDLIDFKTNASSKLRMFAAYLSVFDQIEDIFQAQNAYYRWCCRDLSRGPSGNEKGSISVKEVEDHQPVKLEKIEEAAQDPVVGQLDDYFSELIAASEAAAPVLNEIYHYYNDNSFELDNFEQGREIHGRLMPVLNRFLKAYRQAAKVVYDNFETYSSLVLSDSTREKNEADLSLEVAYFVYYEYAFNNRLGGSTSKDRILLSDLIAKLREAQRVNPGVTFLKYGSRTFPLIEILVSVCNEKFFRANGACNEEIRVR